MNYHLYKNCLNIKGNFDLSYKGILVGNIIDKKYNLQDVWDKIKDFTYLDISCERICNLKCPSCRKVFVNKHNIDNTEFLYKNIYDLCLRAKIISGATGDFFSNINMMKVLSSIPEDNTVEWFEFHTNGVLLNEYTWNKLKNIHRNHNRFFISVDGWTKDVYEINRFPAKFEVIERNLKFVSELCNKNKYFLNIIMVVQENNYKQIPLFLEKCRLFNAVPSIKLISNWNTFSNSEFLKKAVHYKEHENFNDFLNILKTSNVLKHYIHACGWNDREKEFLQIFEKDFPSVNKNRYSVRGSRSRSQADLTVK